MHPRRSDEEYWVGSSWLARQLGIYRGAVRYWAIKSRLRYFSFSGVRYIEREDAKCLLDKLQERYKFSNELKAEVIEKM